LPLKSRAEAVRNERRRAWKKRRRLGFSAAASGEQMRAQAPLCPAESWGGISVAKNFGRHRTAPKFIARSEQDVPMGDFAFSAFQNRPSACAKKRFTKT